MSETHCLLGSQPKTFNCIPLYLCTITLCFSCFKFDWIKSDIVTWIEYTKGAQWLILSHL